MKINENIAYARSILNKLGINNESDEYSDYLEIRKICGTNNGYVGILTKLRFFDNVFDLDELSSIFDILKNSDINVNKLNKLTYKEILELFYDDLVKDESKEDFELVFKDDRYSYYRVYTYKGILEIGSPAWCLKTKKNWDRYQIEYPNQWVIIDNDYKGKLVTPNNNYFSDYKNNNKPWVRYGVSVKIENDNSLSYSGFSDGNVSLVYSPDMFTFFGVLSTILNIEAGIFKSYFDRFPGCESFSNTHLKVVDNNIFLNRLRDSVNVKNWIKKVDSLVGKPQFYVKFTKEYNAPPSVLVLHERTIHYFFLYENVKDSYISKPVTIKCNNKMVLDYIGKGVHNLIYCGFKLKNGLINIEDITKVGSFVKKIGNWLIFNRNDSFLLVVNTLENTDFVDIPSVNYQVTNIDLENPAYWYLDKSTLKPYLGANITNEASELLIRDYHLEVIDMLKEYITRNSVDSVENPKKIKKFWNFLKRNKN